MAHSMRRYMHQQKDAIVIQRHVRGMQARKRYRLVREEMMEVKREDMSILINRVIRGCLARKRFRKRKERVTRAAYFVQDRMKRFVLVRKKKKQVAALNIQRVFRGFVGRDVARIESYRVRNMAQYDLEQRAARALQSFIRMHRARRWFLRTIRMHRLINTAAVCIRRSWKAYRFRVNFYTSFREMKRAVILIQTVFRGRHGMRIAAKKRRAMVRAALDIQRVFRASRSRKVAAALRLEIEKAWKWLRPYHVDHTERKTWGFSARHFALRKKTRHQIRKMGIAYPDVQRILRARQKLRDAMYAENPSRLREALDEAKSVGIDGDDIIHAEHLLDRVESFQHLLPRSTYLTRPYKYGKTTSDRYGLRQSVEDLLRASNTPIERSSPNISSKIRAALSDMDEEDTEGRHKHRVKTLQDATREVDTVAKFSVTLDSKRAASKSDHIDPLPEPLWRSHKHRHVSPRERRKWLSPHRASSKTLSRTMPSTTTNTMKTTTRSVRLSPIGMTTTRNADLDTMRINLEAAKHMKAYKEDVLLRKRRGDLSPNAFRPTVPIPRVRHGAFIQTNDVAREYLFHLSRFSDPSIVFDQNRFTQHVHDSFVFLDVHWKRIIEDVHAGTLHPSVPVTPEERREYLRTASPCPKQALQAERWLKGLGFHRRRLVAQAGFDMPLYHQTKDEDLPLMLENAMRQRSGSSVMESRSGSGNRRSGESDEEDNRVKRLDTLRLRKGAICRRTNRTRTRWSSGKKTLRPLISVRTSADEMLRHSWPRGVPWALGSDNAA